MQFLKSLYVGSKILNVNKVKKQILNRSFFVNAYVIALACNEDQLDIFDAKVLRQRYFHQNPRMIVGIAADYDEAVELIMLITQESITHGYTGDLKGYLLDKEKE